MRKAFLGLIAAAALCVFPPAAHAATCQDEYFAGAAPRLSINAQAGQTKELCYSFFALLHSSKTRTALYSAERLTAQNIRAARSLKRTDRFHEEPALPKRDRASTADYTRSGYDRGHLAPSGNMPNAAAQRESFSLANMAPQAPALNRGLWEDIEDAARTLAERQGEIYVVTGPLFSTNYQTLNGRVAIPSGFFKAIYDPRSHTAGAYIAMNAAGAGYQIVSITKLREMSGLDVFPTLPLSIKTRPANLLQPGRARVAALGGAG